VLYTIGFAGRTAQSFFEALAAERVRVVLDIRLRPSGQLAGYARQQDLPYFLEHLADGCAYEHVPELAPSDEILRSFRDTKDWAAYVAAFESLMDERGIPGSLDPEHFDRACLLCSEPTAARCHRRLVAERLAAAWPGLEVRHL
jgi:uncharacterized protein (DUF488 family)